MFDNLILVNTKTGLTVRIGDKVTDFRGEEWSVASNYGDRSRTLQALPIHTGPETVQIRESGYSESGYAVVTQDDEDWDGWDVERDEDNQMMAKEFLLIR